MRLVDRFMIILIGLALISVITVLMLAPESVITALRNIETLSLLLRLAVVVAVNIAILVLLYFLARVRRQPSSGLAVKAAGAFTDVSVESARTLILNAVKAVPDVTAADATVKAIEGHADVDLNIQVSGRDVHIPQKQKEINRALAQVINKQLGLRIRGKPRVHITLEGEQPVQNIESGSSISQSVAQTPDTHNASSSEATTSASSASTSSAEGSAKVTTVSADEIPDDEDKPVDTLQESNNRWLDNHTSKVPIDESESDGEQD